MTGLTYIFLSHFKLYWLAFLLLVAVTNSILCSGRSRIFQRGRCQPSNGAPTYDFAKYSQKLHEIERIWTPGRASKILLCRSATENCMKMKEFGPRGDSPGSVTTLFFYNKVCFLTKGNLVLHFWHPVRYLITLLFYYSSKFGLLA